MASEKTVTYTAEQTATLVDGYKAGETVEALAAVVGKSVRSVVAKLSREGVYKAKTAKAVGTKVTKADLVGVIALTLNCSEELVESLEKATHPALELLVKALTAKSAE